MDNIFLPGNENIVHFLINAWACLCQFIFFHQSFICSRGWHSNLYLNQASADMRDSVTTSVTLHGLCHPECKGDSSSNCSPCPHRWTDYKQTPKWPQVCAWQVCTQTYAKNFSPTLTCLQYMTQDLTYYTPALSTPTPLKAAALGACACESVCGLGNPPSLYPLHSGYWGKWKL